MPNPLMSRRRVSTGRSVKAAQFNGANSQFLELADNAALSMGAGVLATCCAWVYPTSLTAVTRFFGKGISSAANVEYQLFINNVGPVFTAQDSNGTTLKAVNATTAPVVNNWFFVVSRHDGATVAISINNRTFATVAAVQDIQDSTNAFRLGTGSTGGNAFTGVINQVGIAKSVLSADEITELWNSGQGKNYADLSATLAGKFTAYYDLDDAGGSGATWLDKASTNHLTAGSGAAAPTATILLR